MNNNNQNNTPLFDSMKQYHQKGITPFDVPGHKMGNGLSEFTDYFGKTIMEIDVNSSKPLDNLSNPIGVIKEAEELTAQLFSADYAFFLVNGTTAGIQGMIMSTCNPGDKIILPRNVHRSAINGLILADAIPAYIEPEVNDELGIAFNVSIEKVKQTIIQNQDAKAILITNPTYYGFTANLKEIVKLAHKYNIIVLVDEAHGTHLGFSSSFPISAMDAGADMSTISFHKTGGSLTQSSVLLMNDGIVDKNHVKTILNVMQTTSASYLLMSSLDVARKNLALNGKYEFKRILKLVQNARYEINNIDGLSSFGDELVGLDGAYGFDETKLSIKVNEIGMTGLEAYDILRDQYNIQMEFGDAYNTLAVISLGDNEKNINILVDALKDMVKKYKKEPITLSKIALYNPEVIVSPRDAFYSHKRPKALNDCEGDVSAEFIMAYPPGIPIVTPGERISKEIIEYIQFLKSQNSMLTGTQDAYANNINVLGF
jgi:arginine/lysine/ornithine decarboxylase